MKHLLKLTSSQLLYIYMHHCINTVAKSSDMEYGIQFILILADTKASDISRVFCPMASAAKRLVRSCRANNIRWQGGNIT